MFNVWENKNAMMLVAKSGDMTAHIFNHMDGKYGVSVQRNHDDGVLATLAQGMWTNDGDPDVRLVNLEAAKEQADIFAFMLARIWI